MGMTDAKIEKVLSRYEAKIKEVQEQILPLTCDADQAFWDKLQHAEQMIPKMRQFLQERRREKVFRWLGFMQGIFYSFGIYTIHQMADHNRPTKQEISEQNPGHPFETCGCDICKEYAEAPASE